MSYPSGRTISFSPNGLGQPTRLGSHATNIRHAPNGQPQSLAYGNGIEAHFSYNTRQLRSQTVYSLAGSPLVHRSLEYDPNGNLGAITDMASSSGDRKSTRLNSITWPSRMPSSAWKRK